jgi:hypothetical protein
VSADHGGPAFPFEFHNQTSGAQESFAPNRAPLRPGVSEQYGGMTLRDYFAGQALSGWIAMLTPEEVLTTASRAEHERAVAVVCYGYADAMLAARTPTDSDQ